MSRLTAGQGRNLFSTFRRGVHRHEPRMDKFEGFELYLDMSLAYTEALNDPAFLTVQLPLGSSGTYNFTIDWGDGSVNTITTFNQAETIHTYSSASIYRVRIAGTFEGMGGVNINFGTPDNRGTFCYNVILITRFGQNFKLVNNSPGGGYFQFFYNLVEIGAGLDLTGPNGTITTGRSFFNNCQKLRGINLGSWIVSNLTSTSVAFEDCWVFNGNIKNWGINNTLNGLSSISAMFRRAYTFNQDISSWAVSNKTNASEMFRSARSFNQNIGAWSYNASVFLTNIVEGAIYFDQDMGNISITNTMSLGNMLDNSGLSVENYSRTLIGMANIANLNGITNRTLGASGLKYNDVNYVVGVYQNAVDARAYLISQGWTITDSGRV